MKKKLSIPSLLTLVFTFALTGGCKIEITVPEGGKVVSGSHVYDCPSGEICVVEVNDFYFDTKFFAVADEGWIFTGWKLGSKHLCAISGAACHLTTKGFDQYEVLSEMVESDETFYLEPEFARPTPFRVALTKVQDKNLRACLNQFSPPKRFAERVRELECSNYYRIASLQGIEAFVGIKRLSLATDASLTDLQPLDKLSRLQSLDLQLGSGYFNAAVLGDLTLLYHLKLNMNSPWRGDANPDLTEMFNLQNLRKLELVDVTSDLNSITSLVNLRELVIDPINSRSRISDLSPLAALTKLETLKIKPVGLIYANEIVDIYPLAGLKKLKILELPQNQVGDISPLAGLTNLESLNLSSNQVSDISPLAGLANLESLALSSNQVSDISPLAGLENLESLALSSNLISDISPLAGLKTLESLILSDNQISDINPLAGIESIPVLDLADNLVSNVSTLRKLYPDTLELGFYVDIDLSRNPITSTGNALDGIRTGWVWLIALPLSCQEYSHLAEQYDSRLVVAHPDATYYAPRYGEDLSDYYIPPSRCW